MKNTFVIIFALTLSTVLSAQSYESKRPPVEDRLFTSNAVELKIQEVASQLTNPKLAWMFVNCFPNTLDTTVHYRKQDGKDDTFFDSQSKTYCDMDLRVKGGCLRVDFGKELDCDSVEIEFFSPDHPTREVEVQKLPLTAEYSCNLADWSSTALVKTSVADDDFTAKIIRFTVHDYYNLHGKKLVASYDVNDKIRYFSLEKPVDRIYAVHLIKDSKEITAENPRANNMQAHYRHKNTAVCKHNEFTLPQYKKGAKLTVAVEGTHGEECVYCVAEIEGELMGFPERAPDYKANQWEHAVCGSDKNNTFFLPLPDGAQGKSIKVYAVFSDRHKSRGCTCNVYICDKH